MLLHGGGRCLALAAGGRWASFNLQKDQLDELRIGSRVELLPAALPINGSKTG